MTSEELIFWLAIALVLTLAFGHTIANTLASFNKKHHLIEIQHDDIQFQSDDDDCDDDV